MCKSSTWVPSEQEWITPGWGIHCHSANLEADHSRVGRWWCDSLLIHRLQTPELTFSLQGVLSTYLLVTIYIKAIILTKPTSIVLSHFFFLSTNTEYLVLDYRDSTPKFFFSSTQCQTFYCLINFLIFKIMSFIMTLSITVLPSCLPPPLVPLIMNLLRELSGLSFYTVP